MSVKAWRVGGVSKDMRGIYVGENVQNIDVSKGMNNANLCKGIKGVDVGKGMTGVLGNPVFSALSGDTVEVNCLDFLCRHCCCQRSPVMPLSVSPLFCLFHALAVQLPSLTRTPAAVRTVLYV